MSLLCCLLAGSTLTESARPETYMFASPADLSRYISSLESEKAKDPLRPVALMNDNDVWTIQQ